MTLNSRISLLKFININFPNPLATFFEYVDFKQFGMPNFLKNILPDELVSSNNNDKRVLDSASSQEGPSIPYNQYWNYSYNTLFFDNCGGIFFSTLQVLGLYIVFKLLFKLTPAKKQKIKHYLNIITTRLELKMLAVIVTTRLLQIYFGAILNLRYATFGTLYQKISFAVGILYALILLLLVTVCLIDLSLSKKGSTNRKLKWIQSLTTAIRHLSFSYLPSSKVGRFMPLLTMFISNFLITIIIALLTQWPLLQLTIISLVHIIVICLSLTPKLFRKKTEKILALATEIGTLLFCWILVWIHLLDSEALSAKKILSWVAIALALILMISGIMSKVAEVYIQWKKKKRLAVCAKNENKILKESLRRNRRARRQIYIGQSNDQSPASSTRRENLIDGSTSVVELQIIDLEKEK
mgnify:FL=1